jgi:hypothetical protein
MSAPVLILMATRNGARWLPSQLTSIAAQDHADWALWVSDDGSTDDTRAIVLAFAANREGRNAVRLVEGPRAGLAAANFLHLLTHPDLPLTPVTHLAFADQDDRWHAHKLSRALQMLAAAGPGPALYGAQSVHVDAAGQPCGRSRRPIRPVTLGNALVQNLVSGHSAVLNPAGAALARAAGAPLGVAFHDWWLSQLMLACGGRLVIDGATVLDYLQHGANTLGAPVGTGAQIARLRLLFGRDYARWIAANLAGLAAAPLTHSARATVDALRAAPAAGPGRLAAFRRLGLHRQSAFGTALLWLAALIGRA